MQNAAKKIEDSEDGEFVKCRPFVKWVGGKTQLLPELLKRVPTDFRRYFEGFVGGGALLFTLQPKEAYIVDANEELITTYITVRDNVKELVSDLKKHYYDKEYFYKIRNVDRIETFRRWSAVQKASRLIFLNKTCFNGLYRVNSKGHFNTPFGRYNNPTIVDEDNLMACSRVLQKVEIQAGDFRDIEEKIGAQDFVYFDPPYVPLNATANFTSYHRSGFDLSMQTELFELCRRLDQRGIKFMVSNSSVPFIHNLYKPFNISLASAKRAINSKATKRGEIDEVIVTNY